MSYQRVLSILIESTIVDSDPVVKVIKLVICLAQVNFKWFLGFLVIQKQLSGKSNKEYVHCESVLSKIESLYKLNPINDFKFI